ncbi:MAG: patatin-like phospholipase family protein [Bacteroidales bacterium]|nr:patatin-like phospholipase family protein [Bacteroidales bacterium]
MKKVLLIVMLLSACVMLHAQTETNRSERLKVGVVLGGGGAKGASHIGVLKYLEELGIPVDYVAGTSMGSIIGGFYAMGYTPDELTQLISGINWSEYIGNKIDRTLMSEETRQRNSTLALQVPFNHESLFDKNPNASFISQLPSAYVNNSSLINLFNDLCVGYQEEMDFNDLPIPFACVATDMITGKEVVLRSGSVPTSMRASMAIPGVFSPVQIDDKVLVDGGLVNNFPADVLREMGADIIIGIEVTSTKDITNEDLKSLPQVFARLVTNSTSAKRKENREICNVHIIPDISGFGMLSFNPEAIETLVGRGYQKASEFHDQLLAIKQAVDASAGYSVKKTLHAPHAMNLAVDSVLINAITINNVSDNDNKWLIRKSRLNVGKHYLQNDIERAMKIYRGTGCFDEITYQVKEVDSIHGESNRTDAYNLDISMKPAMPHLFGLGVRYDTEEGAALLLSIGINEKRFTGSKLNLKAKLSYNPRIDLTYTYSRSSLANFNLAYHYKNDHFNMLFEGRRSLNLRYQQQRVSGSISQFHLLNFSTSVGLAYTSTTFDVFTMDEWLDTTTFASSQLIEPFVNVKYDCLDDAYFAKHGFNARLNAMFHFDTKKHHYYDWEDDLYAPSGKYLDLFYAFQSYLTPNDGRFTIIPQVYGRYLSGNSEYYHLWNKFGGEVEGRHFDRQLPFIGYASVEGTDDHATVLRCDLRYNLFGKHYLTAMYNYLINITSTESFDTLKYYGIHGAGLKYSYNSLLGPISLTAHWARRYQENHFGAYFSFGYTF